MIVLEWYYYLVLGIVVGLICIRLFVVVTSGKCKNQVSLVGKTAIVTGGRGGIGFETSLHLAIRGCKVIIADVVDATDVVNEITEITHNPLVSYKHLNLGLLSSVRQFANEIINEEKQIDILICNAGVATLDNNVKTVDGLERTMQINYFGHYLLTHLLGNLVKKVRGRIVIVSSWMAWTHNLTVANLNSSHALRSYQNSKLALIVASQHLADKFSKHGVIVNSVHPGYVRTNIYFMYLGENRYMFFKYLYYYVCVWFFSKNAKQGAQTSLFAAYDPKVSYYSGKFLSDCRPFPKPFKAHNKVFCENLIKATEKLIHLSDEEKSRI